MCYQLETQQTRRRYKITVVIKLEIKREINDMHYQIQPIFTHVWKVLASFP